MAITQQTLKILWGTSGNRCAFTDCGAELIKQLDNWSGLQILGDQAHIVGSSNNGPRRINAELDEDLIDSHENLILLCKDHHKLIDTNEKNYPVSDLLHMKKFHQENIQAILSQDDILKNNAEFGYIELIKLIEESLGLDEEQKDLLASEGGLWWTAWLSWTSGIICNADSRITEVQLNQLKNCYLRLRCRIKSNKYEDLEYALDNLQETIGDFIKTFEYEIDYNPYNDTYYYVVRRFYRDYSPHEHGHDKYYEQVALYDDHNLLLINLLIEIARSVNSVIDQVRDSISPRFRQTSGYVFLYNQNMEITEISVPK